MRGLAAVAALFAVSAWADSVSEYGTLGVIRSYDPDGPHRIELPFEAYRDMKPDASDIRVFNAAGESLPIAFAAEPELVKDPPAPVTLPLFALWASQAGLNGQFTLEPDGTIITMQGRVAGQHIREHDAYLADASKVGWWIGAVELEWEIDPRADVAGAWVNVSDDLRTWQRGSSAQTLLLNAVQDGVKVEQKRVVLAEPVKAKYLRIVVNPSNMVELKSVRAIPYTRTYLSSPVSRRSVHALGGTPPGTLIYDLGARLPVEAFRMTLPMGVVVPFKISTRESGSAPWTPLLSTTYYRFRYRNPIVQMSETEIDRRFMRQVQFEFDATAPGSFKGAPPDLEVQWRPSQLIYLARGARPLTLAFNNPDAQRKVATLGELIPGYMPGDELKVSQDKIVSVSAVTRAKAPPDGLMQRAIGAVKARSTLAWGVLALALGWLLWRWRTT